MHYSRRFCKKRKHPGLNFRAFGRKTQYREIFEKFLKISDENSIEKFNFLLSLGKLLLKIAFVNSTIFYYIFSIYWGDVPYVPPPPGGAYGKLSVRIISIVHLEDLITF